MKSLIALTTKALIAIICVVILVAAWTNYSGVATQPQVNVVTGTISTRATSDIDAVQPEIEELNSMSAIASHAELNESAYETELLAIVQTVQAGQLKNALQLVEEHLSRYPKSRVGSLLKADILAAKAGDTLPQTIAGLRQDVTPAEGFDIKGLRAQIKNRWLHRQPSYVQNAHTKLPSNLINFGNSKHALVADMQNARLYVYKNNNGMPLLVADYYLTVGSQGWGKEVEGDLRTPIGVYVVNRFIAPETLPDLYGSGAFPINYPNIIDRAKKRTGYGIWLHGTPSDTYARSPWASEGCFVVSNQDFEHIQQFISVEERTPVILAEKIEWIPQDQFVEHQQRYLDLVESWRKAWESLDTQAYLNFYADQQLNVDSSDYAAWMTRKRTVNANKTFIRVGVKLTGLYLYPGEQETFVVSFEQEYESNNYSGTSHKQQYWQKDAAGQWQIIYDADT